MKDFFYKLLFSKAGPYITGAIVSGLAILSTKGASYGVELTPEQQVQVAGWLSNAIVTIGLGLLINKAATATKKIQVATGVTVDGVAGDETVKGVEDAVTSPPRKLPTIGGAGK